jgi:hypothetical protein
MLGPLQRGSHEEQERPVHVMNGAQVTPAFGSDPCLGSGIGDEGHTYTLSEGGISEQGAN